MAVTIVRTSWIDDDGTGTTGTVINNAVKTALYNEIDGALAKLPQLAGGNTFTGNQAIAGLLNVTGMGAHTFAASGVGPNTVGIMQGAPGANNWAGLQLGNDVAFNHTQFFVFSSTASVAAPNAQSGATLTTSGTGGFAFATTAASTIRYYTNSVERLRIAATGEVLVNTAALVASGQVGIATDFAGHNGLGIQNLSVSNAGNFQVFANSAGATAGAIAHTGATTVAYNTSSDARLKDDAGRAGDLSALRAVVVHDFAWKADGRADRGVFAQEAHAVFPRAVSPGTDETTESGTLARPWMTDYSKFVPDLIVGWQQHDADLAELRAQLATLKGSH